MWTSVNLNLSKLSLLSKGANSTTDVGCCWRYLQGLSELIWEYQNTTQGRRTLDSYMKWHVIKFARSALSEPYRDAGKILEKVFVLSIGLAKDKILITKYLLFLCFFFVVFFKCQDSQKEIFFKKIKCLPKSQHSKSNNKKVSTLRVILFSWIFPEPNWKELQLILTKRTF